MPESKQYSTQILIEGGISPALKTQLKELGASFKRIAGESKEVGKEGKKGFELFAKGAEQAKEKVIELKEVMSEVLLPLLGITAGIKVFTGIGEEVEGAVEKFKGLREQTLALRSELMGTDFIAHGGNIDVLMKQYENASAQLSEEMGGIFGKGFFTGIQSDLVQVGLGPALTKPLTEALTNFAAMRKGSIKDLTKEDVKSYADMVDMALRSGKLGKIGRQFGLNEAQGKQFKAAMDAGNKALAVSIILQGSQFKIARKFIDTMRESPEGELMKARTANAAELNKLGADWAEAQERGEIAVLRLGTAMAQVLEPIGQMVNRALPSIERGWEGIIHLLGTDYYGLSWWIRSIDYYLWKYVTPSIETMRHKWEDFANSPSFKSVTKDLGDIGVIILGWSVSFVSLGLSVETFKMQLEGPLLGALHKIGDYLGTTLKHMLDEDVAMIKVIDDFFHGRAILPVDPNALKQDFEQKRKMGAPNLIPHAHARGAIVTSPEIGLVGESGPELISPLEPIQKLGDLSTSQLDKLGQLNDFGQAQLDQLTEIATTLGTMAVSGAMGGGGTGIGGGSGGSGGNVFEQYPWEGHAANFGPKGNKLGEGYGVGLGVGEQAATGAHFGDMVRINFADGTSLTRQVNETSERNMGVEFFSGHPGSYNTHGRATVTKLASGGIVRSTTLALLGEKPGQSEAVVPLSKGGLGLGGNFTANFAPVLNIMGGNNEELVDNIKATLETHFETAMTAAFHEFTRKRLA